MSVNLRDDKLLVHNGTWRGQLTLPIAGEGTSWHAIKLGRYGTAFYLEFEIWGKAYGETNVQDLVWFVFGLDGAKPIQKTKQIIRHRRLSDTKKMHYLDRTLKHGIQKMGTHWRWFFKDESGALKLH